MKTRIVFAIFLFIFSVTNYGQEKARIMTYNILNYPDLYTSRNQRFKTTLDYVRPDILVCQEMTSQYAVNLFLSNVLNNKYKAATFIDGYDTDNALFYKDSLFEFISNVPIDTDLRDISQFTLRHKITNDTLLIYSVHLKANSGQEQVRLAEVSKLRAVTDKLPVNKNYIVLGDFNTYTSSEPAFLKLLDKTTTGYFIDPINAVGNWNNNSAFKSIHTQSTRLEALPDGGSTGGLDDRFDMILISQAVKDAGGIKYVPGTYTIVGNDGNHFNKSINLQPNNAVSSSVADALYYASDHLPVYAEFEFQGAVDVDEKNISVADFSLRQNYPNPFNPSTTINFTIPSSTEYYSVLQNISLKVYDILGNEVVTLVDESKPAGNYSVKFDGSSLVSGIYFYKLKTASFVLTKKMLLLK